MLVYKKGSRGEIVKEIQRALNLYPDGIYGLLTEERVKEWQKEHGLKADGIVGPATYAALDKATAGKKTGTPSEKTYSVIIRNLDKAQADAIANNYPGAEIVEG